jgi:hypothetical protein
MDFCIECPSHCILPPDCSCLPPVPHHTILHYTMTSHVDDSYPPDSTRTKCLLPSCAMTRPLLSKLLVATTLVILALFLCCRHSRNPTLPNPTLLYRAYHGLILSPLSFPLLLSLLPSPLLFHLLSHSISSSPRPSPLPQGLAPELLRSTYMRFVKFSLFPIAHMALTGR